MAHHGRPPTLLPGQQGDHTTAFTVFREAAHQSFQSQMTGGAHYQAAGAATLAAFVALPGHEAPRIAQLPAPMAHQHQQAFATAQAAVNALPTHSYPTAHAQRRASVAQDSILAFENTNPLASTFEGGTGGGEGHAMRSLRNLNAAAAAAPLTAPQRRATHQHVQRLFDAENASNAMELEHEAVPDDHHQFLPGVQRAGGVANVAQARADLAQRHQSTMQMAFPHAVASAGGGGGTIRTRTIRAMEEPMGRGDEAY